ncbi:MAG: hypothetical protein ACREBG_03530 [Pyrinomonadaceae bacterium]
MVSTSVISLTISKSIGTIGPILPEFQESRRTITLTGGAITRAVMEPGKLRNQPSPLRSNVLF